MMPEGKNLIAFEVETSRILELLSKEIYDSPYALLRENVQNAYDAILMRYAGKKEDIKLGEIHITVEQNRITIADDGIGMTEDVLRNNFWKAGSSGKRTELARRSGVVGTFGIGAMANFGVCTRLCVETRSIDSDVTLVSIAERENLAVSKDCIELQRKDDDRPPGTKIVADLDPDSPMDEATARSYLEPYIRFLPVKVFLNGNLISQNSYEKQFTDAISEYERWPSRRISQGIDNGDLQVVTLDQMGRILARLTDIKLDESPVLGELFLIQNGGQIMGFRSNFGLAPVPITSHYQFGGVANLSTLEPTAGREALGRESIEYVNRLVQMTEVEVSKIISETDLADRNTCFFHFLLDHNRPELAKNVSIQVLPVEEGVPMGQVSEYCKGKKVYYYGGREQSILQTFASEETYLLHLSQNNPRRKVQLRYINNILKVDEVPDRATILRIYSGTELSIEEAALFIKITSTLNDDYLLPNVKVDFADISHGVAFLVEKKDDKVLIYLARDSAAVRPVLECYKTAYEVFGGFIKDFVRVHLYQRFAKYVPSATREGADALCRLLQRNRELYRYEESERGYLEPLLGDYLSGNVTLAEVLKDAKRAARPQHQTVRKDQVGKVEQELPDVVQSPAKAEELGIEGQEYEPAPAIMRSDVESTMKILATGEKYPQLNNFELFLGLSDRLFKREGVFFYSPHTTQVIWAVHRVIYIFTHASGKLNLYYDIQLKEPLGSESAGGNMLPTTTLITRNRIYIPVPGQLIPSFEIVEGVKEFYVRFDTIP